MMLRVCVFVSIESQTRMSQTIGSEYPNIPISLLPRPPTRPKEHKPTAGRPFSNMSFEVNSLVFFIPKHPNLTHQKKKKS